MPVIQISKVIHCLGTSGELPDRLELGQLGMTTDTGDVLIGAQGLPQVAGRQSYPYQNLKILTELDVQKTMTGDVYHHGPLYKQDLIASTGVMDVPLFKKDPNQVAQYGVYDYSFTSTQTSQLGQINVVLNGTTPHITTTGSVWGLIQPTTFSFNVLLIGDQVMMRVSWTPSDLGQEIYTFHMAGREWNALVAASSGTPPPPKPLPGSITDLLATAMSPTTVQLTYTNADGAIAHEYRINGGAISPMTSDKVVIGLSASTSYNFEVRGVNANGNGPWSNVASATTLSAIQSYPDSWNVLQGKVLTVTAPGVLANDVNAFGLSMTAELVTPPVHGTLTLNSNGGFVYTPTTSFYGTDSFVYRPWDGTRYGPNATVTLTVQQNAAPVALGEGYSLNENSMLSIAAPGVLSNDYDPNNDTISAVLVSSTVNGTLNLSANGSFTYTPASNFVGTDSFTYKAFDGISYSSPVTVSLTVNSTVIPNRAPVSVSHAYNTNENVNLVVPAPGLLQGCSDPDGDPMTVNIVQGPTHGVLGISQSTGSFTYYPSSNFYGTETMTYTVSDGKGGVSNVSTITVTVAQVVQPNRAPVASPDTYTMSEDQILVISAPGVLQNDTDADGDPLTAVLVSNVAHGTLSLNSNGGFTYTPAANYNGQDSFTYKPNDGKADGTPVTVTINITPVDDPDQFVSVADKSVTNTTTVLPSSVSWGINPNGTLTVGMGTSPTTVYGNWLVNTIDGVIHHPEAYEIRASTSDVNFQHDGMTLGVWNNLGTARVLGTTWQYAGVDSVAYTIEIRPVNGNIINTATITLTVDTSAAAGGGGGGGGGGCVWVDSLLADNSLAGEAALGHNLTVLNEDGYGYHIEGINNVSFGPQPCATLVTESGIELTCSYSTPIAIRFPDGSVNTIKLVDCVGQEVPVLDFGEFRWERIVGYTDAGVKQVALINVNDGIYAAGNEADRFIFTHNMTFNNVQKV